MPSSELKRITEDQHSNRGHIVNTVKPGSESQLSDQPVTWSHVCYCCWIVAYKKTDIVQTYKTIVIKFYAQNIVAQFKL